MRLSVDEAIQRIETETRELHRIEIPVGEIAFEPGFLVARGDRLRLDLAALAHLCASARAPFRYISRLDPQLRARLLRHHVGRGDFGTRSVTAISRQGRLICLAPSGLALLSGPEVVTETVAGIPKHYPVDVHDLRFRSNFTLEVDFLSDEMIEAVSNDDVLAAGLEIQHSLIGLKATVVHAYIYRRICKNGMTHRECVLGTGRTRRLPHGHPRARQLQRAQVRRLAGETWATLRRKLRALRELGDKRVDVDPLLRRWLERTGLSAARFMPLLLDAWELEPQATAYGVVNALTRVATHATQLRPRHRRLLNGIAGLLAFQNLHQCPRCHSLVRQPVADD